VKRVNTLVRGRTTSRKGKEGQSSGNGLGVVSTVDLEKAGDKRTRRPTKRKKILASRPDWLTCQPVGTGWVGFDQETHKKGGRVRGGAG